ncbi:protein NRT1/ PTR FAMILY 2.11-like [Lycium barbarum]|uniref:protein NRT1/ PTR FAMILY 2.11-like n=1 Tax=Lycium barbarum TaxID=112863 RepID=UPI00293EE0FE|nr:protein NRT1/ PTR FAMILY 2.11-like [Lycium barbarum]
MEVDKVPAREEPKYGGIKAMPFIIGNETFEKLGTIGTSSNLLVYLTTVFNMKSITATNLINVFNGTCNFGTVLGAFLSDTYLGRYKTLGIASISSFTGMLLLALTAAISKLHPPHCGTAETSICLEPTTGQLAFLLCGFALLIIGASGIRPCNLAFGADQFNPNTESGRKGINSFFNWYYFTFTFAMMVSLTVIVYIQSSINWAIGLAIPTFLMFLSCVFFFVGTKIYVIILPEGSPLTSMVQVLVAAIKKRRLNLPQQSQNTLFNHVSVKTINSELPYTDQFRFLNKASILSPQDQIKEDGSAVNPWRLCSIQQVEEVKCVVRVFPIWVAGLVYYIVLVQMQTYVVFQTLQSDRRLYNASNFKIPAASYAVFSMLSMSIWIPIYDRLIVPFLRKITKKEAGITVLQKMGIGLVIAVFTMLVSAVVETRRRNTALRHPTLGIEPRRGEISAMSANWLIPQLALAGLSEAFTVIAQIEFFYKQFPENMRSFAGSFLFCGFALASYMSSLLISIVHRTTRTSDTENWLAEDLNKGKLDYFYYLVAGLEVLDFGYFLICAKWYKYKGTQNDHNLEVAMDKLEPTKPLV